jgi:hypothetical protein
MGSSGVSHRSWDIHRFFYRPVVFKCAEPSCYPSPHHGIGVAILGAGMGAGAWFGSVYPPIFAITSIGIMTFFHLLYHSIRSAPDAPIQDRDIRIAITGSITMTYLTLVGFGAFMHLPATGIQQAPLAQSLVTSFTTVVGIVIAFYFGTSAYLESKKPGSSAQEPKSQQSTSAPKAPGE